MQYYTREGKEVTSGIIGDGKKVGFMEDRYCPRCGGRGRGPWFPDGGICYRCGGSGDHHQAFVKLYTREQLDKLNERAEKIRQKKEADKAALAESVRAETFYFHGELLNRAEKICESSQFSEFIYSVLEQAKRGKVLSNSQISALGEAVLREEERLIKESRKGEAPEGRIAVLGTILATKAVESPYGVTDKMLVELENFSTVWGTCPSRVNDLCQKASIPVKGAMISFEASFERAENDNTHAFFKRPTKVTLLSAVAC